MSMKILFLAILLTSSQTHAQESLTKEEEGQLAVSQCYSECSARYLQLIRHTSLLGETAWGEDHCETGPIILDSLNACKAGCADVESAFGTTTSTARERFLSIYNDLVDHYSPSGLWNENGTHPEPGTTEFETACVQHLSDNAEYYRYRQY